jgi:hypothetical protein
MIVRGDLVALTAIAVLLAVAAGLGLGGTH